MSYSTVEDTHEIESICIWMVRDVFHQVPAGHPIRNELEGIDGGTQKGDNILVRQVPPQCSHLMEGLWVPSAPDNGNLARRTHLLDLLRVSLGVHFYMFNTHLRTIEDPFIHASGNGWKAGVQKRT